MPQTIHRGIKALCDEANAQIETVTAAQAIEAAKRDDVVIVDIRDPREIERDGFPIAAKLECLLSSDSDVGMAKTLGLATLSLADVLAQMRPDLLLLIADRYEMLAPASVALTLRIPVAHIEGGEVSEGAIDDAVRNALTKMSHIHFTSTEEARARVIAMGEEPAQPAPAQP